MIDPTVGKEIFEDIIKTEPSNRPWVLSVIINCLLGIGLIVTFYVFSNRAEIAEKKQNAAERELAIQRASNLKDNRDCNALILQANKECEEKWQAKFDNERTLNQKYLEDKAARLEQEIEYLRNETRKVKSRTEKMKSKIDL